MKETTKTSRTAGMLEKMFRELNADSFGGELEEPIITIQSTPRAYGHVSVHRVWKRKEDWRHELNLGAETINRPIEEVTATIIHEMVHLYNIKHNIQDCSRGGSYHNAKFRDEAKKHMIEVKKDEKYGWTITEVTEELLEYIIKKGWTDFQIGRMYFPSFGGSTGTKTGDKDKTATGTTGTAKKGNSKKYVCPKCGNIIRATKNVNVICGDCNEKFVIED